MLKVITSDFDAQMKGGFVVVETDATESNQAYDELRSPEARNMAIKEAATKGLADPRINGNPAIVLVDVDGKPVTDPATQKVAAFRAKIDVIRRLI